MTVGRAGWLWCLACVSACGSPTSSSAGAQTAAFDAGWLESDNGGVVRVASERPRARSASAMGVDSMDGERVGAGGVGAEQREPGAGEGLRDAGVATRDGGGRIRLDAGMRLAAGAGRGSRTPAQDDGPMGGNAPSGSGDDGSAADTSPRESDDDAGMMEFPAVDGGSRAGSGGSGTPTTETAGQGGEPSLPTMSGGGNAGAAGQRGSVPGSELDAGPGPMPLP